MPGEDEMTISMRVREKLLSLAQWEDDMAAAEAAAVPYWAPYPDSVRAHRMAAAALRADALGEGPGVPGMVACTTEGCEVNR
jgi:hypothetical protein